MSRENSLLVRSVFLNKFSGANLLLWPPYCHRPLFPFLEGGNAVRFFTLCFLGLVRCLSSSFCRSSLLRVVVRKIFGSELLFLGVGVGLVCFGVVLPMFLLYCLLFRSRNCLNAIDVRSGVFRLSSFFLWCFADVVVFFFQRDSSGSNRAHPHTHLFCCFLFCFCVPPRLFLPVLAVRPASWRFFGVPFWTPRVFWILLGPSEAFSWDARRQGFSVLLLPCFLFPHFVVFCGCFFFTRTRRGRPVIERGIPPVIEPAPRPSEGPGSAIVRGRLDTAFRDTFFALTCLAEGHRDPLGLFLWGGGAFSAPSGPFSHALVFVSPPQVFFFCGLRGQACPQNSLDA